MTAARPHSALACFVIGALLVLLIEAGIARIVGVPLMFAGLVLGVAAIATPEFLAGDRDTDVNGSRHGPNRHFGGN